MEIELTAEQKMEMADKLARMDFCPEIKAFYCYVQGLVKADIEKKQIYSWHDAEKDKPEDGKDVLVCFSGAVRGRWYLGTYSVGCYFAEEDEWELQEFGASLPRGIQIHGWKEIEPFDLEG